MSDLKSTWLNIPGSSGLPYIGDTLKLVTAPAEYAKSRYQKYGKASRFVVLGKPSVLLIGPEANELLVKDKEHIFSCVQAYEPFIGELFPGTLGMKDFEDHSQHRRILQAAFHKKSLMGYVKMLHNITDQQLSEWPIDTEFEFFHKVKDLLLEQAAQMFLGQKLDKNAHLIGTHFLNLVNASTAVFRIPIPGTPYWKAIRSKQHLWKFLESQLEIKRANDTPDLFSQVCHARSEEGEALSDMEVVGHMLGLMSAAHDTNTSSVTSMTYALAKWQDVQLKMLQEFDTLKTNPPQFETLRDMTYTANVFKETLRLWGPSHTVPRGVLNDFEFEGYMIPKGSMVYLSPSFTHRMEEYWSAPDQFDPDRFAPPREEQKQHKYLYMPFGGGAHACLGMVLAEIQTKVFFWHFLKKFSIELANPNDTYELSYSPLPEPKNGLRIILKPR